MLCYVSDYLSYYELYLKTDLFSNTRTKYINKINLKLVGGRGNDDSKYKNKNKIKFF